MIGAILLLALGATCLVLFLALLVAGAEIRHTSGFRPFGIRLLTEGKRGRTAGTAARTTHGGKP